MCSGGGPAQLESEEEDDEDQEARNKELQRIHAELQKADDRCTSFMWIFHFSMNDLLSFQSGRNNGTRLRVPRHGFVYIGSCP